MITLPYFTAYYAAIAPLIALPQELKRGSGAKSNDNRT